jgi:aspartate/methionine/tyrosine aminotransferase
MRKRMTSDRAERFTESVIRDMTRLAQIHNAVNLAQGMPDFPAPPEIKEAACSAIMADVNQYAITWGAKGLRDAVAAKAKLFLGLEVDPEREITVTCGSTEAMISALMAVINPGDEVVIFEPFYENYGPDTILSGAIPRYVTLRPPEWNFDPEELESAFNEHTKAIIINTPNNPTGKVLSREELRFIADLCVRWDALALTDEIYEHILYDTARHCAMATLDGMRDRTVTINGMSKTYSVTGWRVGYAIAPPHLTNSIRKIHDFLTVGAPAPLQEAGARALAIPVSYYSDLAAAYQRRRDILLEGLREARFRCTAPSGAYYIMADFGALSSDGDVGFTHSLIRDAGVAVVPGSSFYHEPNLGSHYVRFCFCKQEATLRDASRRLQRLSRLKASHRG